MACAGRTRRSGSAPTGPSVERLLPAALPCLAAELRPAADAPDARRPARAGVCGNWPAGKAVHDIEEAGAELVGGEAFADHHRYRRAEVERLLARARAGRARSASPRARTRSACRPICAPGSWSCRSPWRWRDPAALDRLLEPASWRAHATSRGDEAYPNSPLSKLLLTCASAPDRRNLSAGDPFPIRQRTTSMIGTDAVASLSSRALGGWLDGEGPTMAFDGHARQPQGRPRVHPRIDEHRAPCRASVN